MKICVLLPDYSTSDVDYQNYDPQRNLAGLYPGATVDHVLLNKLTTYKQLRDLKKNNYDIFVNLCEGYLEWSVPSIDVIHALEILNLPFTGPTALLYDPPKTLMKYVAYCEGVHTPAYVLIDDEAELEACGHLRYPLFVKPGKAGDSLGIDEHSFVQDTKALEEKVAGIIDEYGPVLVEEYIDGREFTVMLAANADGKTATIFKPVEYIFPAGNAFKTYALKTSELHPGANIPCSDPALEARLREAAAAIFKGFGGVGYARLDFRVNDKNEIFFLEINFTCSVFYADGYEGSADYILKHDGFGTANFLRHIIEEGMARHARNQKPYELKGNAIAGYGIYARRNIEYGEIIFTGEGRAQRMVTRNHVERSWNEKDKAAFRRYAYPISEEVFLLWDNDPSGWAPQNHSCEPNTGYRGLDVIALQPITKGAELTLDYTSFLDESMEPFQCRCGAAQCRGLIAGIKNNSITDREKSCK